MGDNSSVVATYVFRGIEYVITMNTGHGNSLLVEVEDRVTADQWRGSFDAAYIEDLTHKTGNFKQFPIFVSMLESAITQQSDSVGLDLLTYSDLESLRNRKGGAGTRNIPGANNKTTILGSKRYLILTYTVEFDRIHYPLPLPYMGKPDPRALQETIRQLRQEIKVLKTHGTKDFRIKEVEKMRKDFEQILLEKEEVENEFLAFRREIQNTREGTAAKEVRVMKTMVKNLEEDLMKEKNKNQRASNKRNQEYRNILDEVEELRASERNLKVRVKSLTNELALYRRQSGANISSSSRRNTSARSSRENSFSRDRSRLSSLSKDRSYISQNRSYGSQDRSRLSDRGRPNSARERSYTSRDRSSSRDRERSLPRNRSLPRERSQSLERSRGRSLERSSTGFRSRTPSPFSVSAAGARNPRFDPTAFIKEKERKKKEADLKQKRIIKSQRNGSAEKRSKSSPAHSDRGSGRGRNVSRSSSYLKSFKKLIGSIRSRNSSIESLSDIGMASDVSESRHRRALKPSRINTNNIPSSPDVSYSKPPSKSRTKKIYPSNKLASTPDDVPRTRRVRDWGKENGRASDGGVESDYFDRADEISEIDERLNRLQQFMKTNLH